MSRSGTRRRLRVWQIIALALFGTAIMGGGIFALVMTLTRPVVTASDAFMTALKDGDFESAFEMGTPELRAELGNADRLGAMFAATRPVSWSWSTRRIRNGTGSVSGSVVYGSGRDGDVAIFLLPEGDNWRISGFRMNPQ